MGRPPILKTAILQYPDLSSEEVREKVRNQGLEVTLSYVQQVRREQMKSPKTDHMDMEAKFIEAVAELGIVRARELLGEIRAKVSN